MNCTDAERDTGPICHDKSWVLRGAQCRCSWVNTNEGTEDRIARWRREDPAWWATYDEYRATTRHCPDPSAHENCVACGESHDDGPTDSDGNVWCGECAREATS